MRIELWIVLVTGFLIYNAYHDNKYTKMLMKGRKYYSMIIYGAMGLGIYLLLKRDPNQAKNMLMYANNAVRYMPINKSSLNLFNPIVDFTSTYNDGDPNANMTGSFMRSFNNANNLSEERILRSGKKGTKRSVSETKKKYVASQQGWRCNKCNQMLTASFEVDHKIELQFGGSNHVSNLAALCRNCHGDKTMQHKLI